MQCACAILSPVVCPAVQKFSTLFKNETAKFSETKLCPLPIFNYFLAIQTFTFEVTKLVFRYHVRRSCCWLQPTQALQYTVCPSVYLHGKKNAAPNGRIFMKFHIWSLSENPVQQIRFSLKSYKNIGYLTWRPMHVYDNIWLNSF